VIESDYFLVFMLDVCLQFFDLLIEVLDGLVTQFHLHCFLLQVLHQLLVFIEAILLMVGVFDPFLRSWNSLILPGPLVLIKNFLSIRVVGRQIALPYLLRRLLEVSKPNS
jgi:hypothetical protein